MAERSFFSRALAGLGLGNKTARQEAFWSWFQNNEEGLLAAKNRNDKIFEGLHLELEKVDDHLAFDIGPLERSPREFVIGADGDPLAFPAVETLCAAAPPLPRWKIIKYRQRCEPTDRAFQATLVQANSLQVAAKKNSLGAADLIVYIPGYSVEHRNGFFAVVNEMLEQALGERTKGMYVTRIELQSDGARKGKTYSLRELPAALDQMFPS
jgi:hypothetical protein